MDRRGEQCRSKRDWVASLGKKKNAKSPTKKVDVVRGEGTPHEGFQQWNKSKISGQERGNASKTQNKF